MVIRVRRVIVIASMASALALACQDILGIPEGDFVVDVADAAPETTTTPPTVSCSAPLPPEPGDAGADGGSGTYFFALRTIVIGGGGAVGFDLDRSCTCAKDAGPETRVSCAPRAGALKNRECDLDGGIDNALFPIAQGFSSTNVKELERGIVKEFNCGRQNLVFVLQDYNGQANDDAVVLFPAPSYGIRDPHPDEPPGANPCAPTWPPRFDGTDRWFIDETFVSPEGQPLRQAYTGYVSNYQLVVDGRLKGGDPVAVVGIGSAPVGLQDPVIVAKLEVIDGGVSVTDGVMGGRAKIESALKSFGEIIPEEEKGTRACNDPTGGWSIVQTALCQAGDIMSDPQRDFSPEACDAISFVVGFTAAPVLVAAGKPIAPSEVDGSAPCDAAAFVCP